MENNSASITTTSESSSESSNTPKWHFSWPHILLSFVGLYLSYQAWMAHLANQRGEDTGCGVTATINCSAVLSSKYSAIFGIPVGLLGMVFFAIVLLTAVSNEANFSWQRFRLTQWLVSCAGFASSVAFIYISKFILHTLCTICLRVHATTFTLFFLSLVLFLIARKKERQSL